VELHLGQVVVVKSKTWTVTLQASNIQSWPKLGLWES